MTVYRQWTHQAWAFWTLTGGAQRSLSTVQYEHALDHGAHSVTIRSN